MFLEKVAALKRVEVDQRKARFFPKDFEKNAASLPSPRDFKGLLGADGRMALIAEIKQASPSAGVIQEGADICRRAAGYQEGGASAISVLTEKKFFQGDLLHLGLAKENTSLPVLQKDFIIDPFQIYEGRVFGADAVLLIAAILGKRQLGEFVDTIQSLGMTPLVEVHNEEDLEKISGLALPLLGINNRDLKTLKVDLGTTLRLMKKVPPGMKVISESGIQTAQDVKMLKDVGVKGILVGEVLMRSADPAAKIRELLQP